MKSRLRIIGGKWRGRKLPVIDADGLRPTPDRIRETLFNWLAPDCRDAVVLDCFAGSGVLGFEALSRGARKLVAIEQNRRAASSLRETARVLQTDAATIVDGDALAGIANLDDRFDLVFIDPPYNQGSLRAAVLARLETAGLLNDGARIYFEWPRGSDFELPSPRLHWLKRKSAAQVCYALAEWRLTV